MTTKTYSSRITGLHTMTVAERLKTVADLVGLSDAAVAHLTDTATVVGEVADRMSENVIGTLGIPVGIATNLIIDGKERVVPLATEESSVVAAVCNAAKQCRGGGGISTSTSGPLMIAQVQLINVSDPENARFKILEHREEIKAICDECDPVLLKFGGGFRELEVRIIDSAQGPMVITHLIVNTGDAMGANAVNTMAEAVGPRIAEWTGGQVFLRILSNLADRRLARARGVWRAEDIGGPAVRDGILAAFHFADADPYRAATHNKGVMNGITAAVLATGNDTRAIESGAHAYAARTGRYRSMSKWEADADGNLVGVLELPMAVGLIGGATKIHPTARACLEILGVETADELARIVVAIGLAQNYAALKVLATTGVQKGHMSLHSKNIAIMAGAEGAEIEAVAARLVADSKVRVDHAEAVLAELRAKKG
ncbi:MAG: hydroxymethylglutaryl-CoA reductase, degradative [Rhodospirillaceae bacterium]|nr:hydroxymethylglutaryl-CoA reductase, degradative [Rhodospirillaceae bacterium]